MERRCSFERKLCSNVDASVVVEVRFDGTSAGVSALRRGRGRSAGWGGGRRTGLEWATLRETAALDIPGLPRAERMAFGVFTSSVSQDRVFNVPGFGWDSKASDSVTGFTVDRAQVNSLRLSKEYLIRSPWSLPGFVPPWKENRFAKPLPPP